jgi:N-acyl-D-amino-acid deacylase
MYPYTASATSLAASIPTWVQDGGRGKMLERLKDPIVRSKIKAELESNVKGPENFYRGTGAEGIMIASVEQPDLKQFEGAMLRTVASVWKKHPIDALMDLLLADSARTGAIYFSMNDQDVRMAMAQPWVCFDTDAEGVALDGPLSTRKTHPRAYGSFSRILKKYVREDNVLMLEEAIRKMTSLAAQRVGLVDRGLVKEGCFADLVLFDPAKVADKATFEQPHQYSEGMDLVVINGQPVWENGAFTGNLPGRVLKGRGAKQ